MSLVQVAIKGNDSGPDVVPGKPDDSAPDDCILSNRMPPGALLFHFRTLSL